MSRRSDLDHEEARLFDVLCSLPQSCDELTMTVM